MDKLIIEFNKKFDKQRQELIDGFKALGEEKKLTKVLATIEGEQPTYKDYFKAGWQSRQAELDQAYEDIETFAQAHQRECGIKVQIANELKEKDKRIEAALNHLNDVRNKGVDQSCYLAIKALRGDDYV